MEGESLKKKKKKKTNMILVLSLHEVPDFQDLPFHFWGGYDLLDS